MKDSPSRVAADENVPKEVVDYLRSLRLEKVYWISEASAGITDSDVWKYAWQKRAILITCDQGFVQQLEPCDFLNGPPLLLYSAEGFDKDELKDPSVMQFIVGWLFRNDHHNDREFLRIRLKGTAQTKRQLLGRMRK